MEKLFSRTFLLLVFVEASQQCVQHERVTIWAQKMTWMNELRCSWYTQPWDSTVCYLSTRRRSWDSLQTTVTFRRCKFRGQKENGIKMMWEWD